MDLYIKQRIFTFNDQFTVADYEGNQLYDVQGKFFSFGDQLTISEVNGKIKFRLSRNWPPGCRVT